jgi:multidrug resistance efflux pump
MSDVKVQAAPQARRPAATPEAVVRPPEGGVHPSRLHAVPVLVTLIGLVAAGVGAWAMWQAYMAAPWTRDGTVRAYVVSVTPQVAGQIVQLPIADNQFVHKGDLLMTIDPTDYAIAVDLAEAAVQQANATADNAKQEAARRANLSTLEASEEEKQTYQSRAVAATAAQRQAVANLAQARVNLQRTTIRSPVNGYITNLLIQLGDYASVGQAVLSVVDADSYWVDGYFEETALGEIHPGDHASIKLMAYSPVLDGRVDSIARGITVSNAARGQSGLAEVNPIFTWVRLAQRVPVRIHIDHVPNGVSLVAGQTASVQINPGKGSR